MNLVKRSGRAIARLASSVGALAVAAAAASAVANCKSGEASTSSGGAGPSSSSAVSTATSSAQSSTSSGGPSCVLPTRPSALAGWTPFEAWSKDCPFYVPTHEKLLPPPIAWQTCPDDDAGLSCRIMVEDWTAAAAPISPGAVSFDHGVLGFYRLSTDAPQPYGIYVIAPVDGQPTEAFGEVFTATCSVFDTQVHEGRYELTLEGKSACSAPIGDVRGAAVGSSSTLATPSVVMCPPGKVCGFTPGEEWLVRIDTGFVITALPVVGGSHEFVSSSASDPEHLQLENVFPEGPAVFFESSDAHHNGINVWTKDAGAKPLVRYIGDDTQGAGDFGTDGKDMVWSYGHGTQVIGGGWPNVDVVMAKYTTDPSQVQSHRLRSNPRTHIGSEPWVVGCGYAAHANGPQPLLVRLSDGAMWTMPYLGQGAAIRFDRPLGVTCDEVFFLGQFSGRWNVARVRLDSLGPGTPPD